MPERLEGDKDTVLAERRPRRADTIRPSPAPVPERHRSGAADWLGMRRPRCSRSTTFTHDEKKALKRTYAREKKLITSGKSDPALTQELEKERTRLSEEAGKRGPRKPKTNGRTPTPTRKGTRSHGESEYVHGKAMMRMQAHTHCPVSWCGKNNHTHTHTNAYYIDRESKVWRITDQDSLGGYGIRSMVRPKTGYHNSDLDTAYDPWSAADSFMLQCKINREKYGTEAVTAVCPEYQRQEPIRHYSETKRKLEDGKSVHDLEHKWCGRSERVPANHE